MAGRGGQARLRGAQGHGQSCVAARHIHGYWADQQFEIRQPPKAKPQRFSAGKGENRRNKRPVGIHHGQRHFDARAVRLGTHSLPKAKIGVGIHVDLFGAGKGGRQPDAAQHLLGRDLEHRAHLSQISADGVLLCHALPPDPDVLHYGAGGMGQASAARAIGAICDKFGAQGQFGFAPVRPRFRSWPRGNHAPSSGAAPFRR